MSIVYRFQWITLQVEAVTYNPNSDPYYPGMGPTENRSKKWPHYYSKEGFTTMNDLYFRIRAKGFTGHGVEDILACLTYDGKCDCEYCGGYQIRLFDNVSNTFTMCHALSKNAAKKLVKAAKIAVENNLTLPQDPHGFQTADWYIEGYSKR